MKRPFKLVDVFHSQPLMGNALAVVFDAITRWLNLSETTFV